MQQERIGVVLASVGALAVAALTLRPSYSSSVPPVMWCVLCGSFGLRDVVLNVLLFVPLGAGLLLAGVPSGRAFATAAALSAAIELVQWAVVPGRSATPGDVLANSAGALLGIALARSWRAWVFPTARGARRLAAAAALGWVLALVFTAWALQPALPHDVLYGQWAPTLGGFSHFEGHVLSAHIDGDEVGSGLLRNGASVRRLLARGETLRVLATPDPDARGAAPIVAVADLHERHLFMLSQRGTDLLFDERTHARALTLNAPRIVLRDAFAPASAAAGTRSALAHATATPADRSSTWCRGPGHASPAGAVRLCAVWRDGMVRLGAAPGRWGSIHLGPWLGWTLLVPFSYALDDRGTSGGALWSALWLAALVFPGAYWWARGKSGASRARTGAIAHLGMSAMVAAAGLAVVPALSGTPPARWSEWGGALLGVLAGAAAAAVSTRTAARKGAGAAT